LAFFGEKLGLDVVEQMAELFVEVVLSLTAGVRFFDGDEVLVSGAKPLEERVLFLGSLKGRQYC
jgi:hypothetical protein